MPIHPALPCYAAQQLGHIPSAPGMAQHRSNHQCRYSRRLQSPGESLLHWTCWLRDFRSWPQITKFCPNMLGFYAIGWGTMVSMPCMVLEMTWALSTFPLNPAIHPPPFQIDAIRELPSVTFLCLLARCTTIAASPSLGLTSSASGTQLVCPRTTCRSSLV